MNTTSETLKNGFKVIYTEDRSNPLVCLQLYVRMGSAWEADYESGFSHFTEHLVFKSSEKYPDSTIMERVTFLGGSINAYTEYDSTCFYVTLPSRFLKDGLEILAELVRHANYSEKEFAAEKKVVIEEFKQYQNDPEDFFIEESARLYFTKNPYAKPIIGDPENLKRSTHADLMKFYQKHYSANNCYLVAVGDIELSEICPMVDEFFGSWESYDVPQQLPVSGDFPDNNLIHHFDRDISSDIISFAIPDLAEEHEDSYALSMIGKAFCIGKNSRLYTRLFTEEKLVDSIKVNSISGINDGCSIIVIFPKKGADLNEIAKIFLEEYELIRRHGLTATELSDNKKELVFHYRYSYEYVEALASSLGGEEVLSSYEKFFRYPELINSITTEKIGEISKKYFSANQINFYSIGKTGFDKAKLEEVLAVTEAAEEKHDSDVEFMEHRLDCGAKLLLKRVLGKPTIGISAAFEVSQLNETKENLGINMLTAGVMLHGNKKRSYQQFMNFCTSNGISFGISPRSETTSVKLKCFKEMLPMSLELLYDVVVTPTFPMEHFSNIKQTYLSNIDRAKDYPTYYAGRLWKQMMFGLQSNLMAREGKRATLNKLSLKQVKEWFAKHYNLQNMSLAIVGDFEFDDVIMQLNRLFKPVEVPFEKSEQKPHFKPGVTRRKVMKKGMNQSVIHVGGFGCTTKDKTKNTAFHILAQIIGGDSDSIMFDELREERGLAYSTEFNFTSTRNIGYFVASAIVDKDREKEALDTIIEILDDIRENGIDEEELIKTKNYVRGQRLMDDESVSSQAQTLAVLESIGLGYKYYNERDARLEAVTLEQMNEIAKEYFKKENYFIHVLS